MSSGDPAVLKPCMTVLGVLSNSFYANLKTGTQVNDCTFITFALYAKSDLKQFSPHFFSWIFHLSEPKDVMLRKKES